MKAQQRQKLKTTPCPSFSCGLFRHCTQNVLSPTTTHPPPLPLLNSDHPPPPLPLPPLSSSTDPQTRQPPQPESESSSSSNTSQSFTQWRFPIPNSPISHDPTREVIHNPRPKPPPFPAANLQELFHVAEVQLSSDSDFDRANALHMLERSLVPNPSAAVCGGEALCPESVMGGVVGYLKERAGAKSATKVLLALCLAEGNRHVAVGAGAVREVVEALADLEGAAAERALAALELLCTVAEGADEVRTHALAVPMMVEVMGKTAGRGKEYAISVLSVIYGGGIGEGVTAPPDAVARAVTLALQEGCSARGRRKGAHLLKILEESERSDLTQEGA